VLRLQREGNAMKLSYLFWAVLMALLGCKMKQEETSWSSSLSPCWCLPLE